LERKKKGISNMNESNEETNGSTHNDESNGIQNIDNNDDTQTY